MTGLWNVRAGFKPAWFSRYVVGATVASFILGALAATVVTSSAPRAPAALYEHEAKIKMELFPNKCVAVDDGIHRGGTSV